LIVLVLRPHVVDLGAAAQQHRDDAALAGDLAELVHGDVLAVVQAGGADGGSQLVVVDRDGELGALAAVDAVLVGVQGQVDDLAERVALPFRREPRVLRPGLGQRVDQRIELRAGLRVDIREQLVPPTPPPPPHDIARPHRLRLAGLGSVLIEPVHQLPAERPRRSRFVQQRVLDDLDLGHGRKSGHRFGQHLDVVLGQRALGHRRRDRGQHRLHAGTRGSHRRAQHLRLCQFAAGGLRVPVQGVLEDLDEILVPQRLRRALLMQRADDLQDLELKLLQRADFPLELIEELKRGGEFEGCHALIVT
jgi:hypothetical protein